VKPADLQRLAQTYLRDGDMMIANTGGVKNIKDQVGYD